MFYLDLCAPLSATHGGQKRTLDPLELKLQPVMSCLVDFQKTLALSQSLRKEDLQPPVWAGFIQSLGALIKQKAEGSQPLPS